MTTTISLPVAEYNRAKTFAVEELSARIDESEKQFERGEYKSHEQMMADLKKEFPWLM